VGERPRAVEDMVLSAGFWAGRRVLLTGHTGFKGAWTARWLARLGAKVSGLALAPAGTPNLYALMQASMKLTSAIVDLRDEEAVRGVVAVADPEIVLHMAAQALVPESFSAPVATWATNVMGTVILLDALRGRSALQAVVVVTSDKVYAEGGTAAFAETAPLGGDDPYSASKAAAELAVASWRRSFAKDGPPIATARAGNVIGGGDWSQDRLVPDLVRAVVAREKLALRNPDATRPWQHVLDPVAGYLMLAERLAQGATLPPALNFGPLPGEARTVRAMAERLLAGFGRPPDWRHAPASAIDERGHLALDAGLAQKSLGWRPRLDIDAAIAWTVEWYKAQQGGADAATLTDAQIARFEQL
jgi:CDP-glucose 4,6-dehydratase